MKDASGRIHWSDAERLQFYKAAKHLRDQDPSLTGMEASTRAMQEMPPDLRRPVISKLVSQMNEWLRKETGKEKRAEVKQRTEPAPPPPPPAEQLPTDDVATLIDEPYPIWQEVSDKIARTLIEATVQWLESPAVRKALRSVVQVVSAKDFVPEVDNTVPWVEIAPIGPRLLRVLIVGFWRAGPTIEIAREFGSKFDLRFWRTDDALGQLKQDLQSADIVVLVAGTSNHTVRQIVVASGKKLITIPLAGGTSMVKRKLQELQGKEVHL